MKKVVIIGRPNVGKSTLFNRLIGKRRAITDPTPGVTRDPITERWILNGHAVDLTDSGGVKLDLEGFDELVSKKSLSLLDGADAILFMMDCTEVTPEDQMLLKVLRPYTDKIVLVVNKIDDSKREDLIWN
jgi:GTP-binding protein